jgi:hypothetical protein
MTRPRAVPGVPAAYNTRVAIEFEKNLLTRLRPEAAKRATTVPRLIHDLLDVIATDRLVTAVLDDDA